MILDVKPVRALQGVLDLPASKSYTIRAFFIAACGGSSSIIGPSGGDDAVVAQRVARVLSRGRACPARTVFDVGESGTTLRFLLPLLSFLGHPAVVKGKGTLVGRPNHHLCAALRRQGMDIRGTGPQESVPIVYKGGPLEAGTIRINGSLSSQFISGLMIALPRLKADSRIVVTGKMVSHDYITMTRRILARAGIKIRRGDPSGRPYFIIPGNQKFKGLKNFRVPSDYGLAAFPLAAALLVPSKVVLKGNFDRAWPQSDGHIINFLKKMGGRFTHTDRSITIKGPSSLKGGVFNLKDCPDLVPVMAVLSLFARSRTKLTGIGHARLKESDRLSDLRKELLKVGAKVSETRDTLVIDPRASYKRGQVLDPHHDHRLAMAFTVLGLKIGCKVRDIQSCAKSYPAFVKDINTLRGHPP
ncbi:MAG: 3-phosphoshikimate 1-carboxyvinyltransferase [Candidatus Omnitrophota bacterium]|nr:3-phosphoshikimate 1-carboxyvinyltransferase [Candidatus Omnitrophota bacterium]